jgi:putative thioredoxin
MSEVSPYIVETTDATFETDVLERSRAVPVVVDFWAEWCGPCRLLKPVLEKLAHEHAGAFVLVKANTDQAQRLAAEFGVRSIPAVFGVRDGQVVDSFVGALPEPAVRAWVERLLPTPAEIAVTAAHALEATDPEAAAEAYRKALQLAGDHAPAQIGLARTLLQLGRDDEARSLIAELDRRGFLEPEAEKVKAELELRRAARQSGGVDAAQAALAADPGNADLKLKLADALAVARRFDEALALCLELVEQGAKDSAEAARKSMLNIFQLLPDDSELVADYRRRLAAALF